jgi:DNA oxidative demethylase
MNRIGNRFNRNSKPNKAHPNSRTSARGTVGNASEMGQLPYGLIYKPNYISAKRRQDIFKYLHSLHPIWEHRFSASHPPPDGQSNRRLLRPVYWLGNWQFACLDYYHPPKGIDFRCVEAEPFPSVLQEIANEMEQIAKATFNPKDIPRNWHFNTCLINFYGSTFEDGKWIDTARVGEHKDFEPGPVGSMSFGERAFFQFISSQHKGGPSKSAFQQWLDDSAIQIFGGDRFKKLLFHRVQRVEKKLSEAVLKKDFSFNIPDFETRRINFTFRYVPTEHVQPLHRYPKNLQEDVRPYVEELAQYSTFFNSLKEEVFKSHS